MGEFVLRQACWQACEWQRQGLAPIRVSVNLSVHQLRQGKLVSLVRQVLEETGLARNTWSWNSPKASCSTASNTSSPPSSNCAIWG
jgi:predicted signal transduction protein with EAL and GGDEF domain